jgi:hypothetical protein
VLYFSAPFRTAAHLCACGCGSEVITPIKPGEWTLVERHERPSLDPSVGNWNLPCKSHYWIIEGYVRWARTWSIQEIEGGRRWEQAQRQRIYRKPFVSRLLEMVLKVFRRNY